MEANIQKIDSINASQLQLDKMEQEKKTIKKEEAEDKMHSKSQEDIYEEESIYTKFRDEFVARTKTMIRHLWS